MADGVLGNVLGAYGFPKTYVLTDESGNEFVGVITESIQIFDAEPKDVRIGKTFVSDNGHQVGENTITYRTIKGVSAVPSGRNFSISLSEHDMYMFTALQCIIAPYDTSLSGSVAADKIVIGNSVYSAGSSDKLSDITQNEETKSVDLNITNNSGKPYVIHYFMYKQEEF